jgi:hypothetical protein
MTNNAKNCLPAFNIFYKKLIKQISVHLLFVLFK